MLLDTGVYCWATNQDSYLLTSIVYLRVSVYLVDVDGKQC